MGNTEVEQPWEQQEDEEPEEGLIIRRKNLNQTPLSTTINGGSIGVSNGKEHEQEPEEVKDFSQQNVIKIDEDEKEKQHRSGYSVYYDTDKGIWKCRICSWDYQARTCLTDRNQDPRRHSHMLVNVKIVDQQRPCFFHETKGTGLHCESSVVEANGVDSTARGKSLVLENVDITRKNQVNGNVLYSVISNQNGEHQKHNNYPDSSLRPSEILFEELDKSFPSCVNNKTESTDTEVIKNSDDKVNEFDVETILKKQDTHDLYCPNCNSCITKRVILRKRKSRIQTPGEDAKRNKPETPISSEVNVVLDDSSNGQAQNGVDLSLDNLQQPASNEYDHQREPEVFRCLSCFSIFMPTGNGFKLFRMFGHKNDEQDNQRTQKEVPVKKGWFSSIFASDKMEQLNDQGAGESLYGENNIAGVTIQSSNPSEPNGLASSRQEAKSYTTNGTTDLMDRPADYVPSSSSDEPNGSILKTSEVLSATPSVSGDDNAPSSTLASDSPEWVADKSGDAFRRSKGGAAKDSPEVQTHDQLLTSYHTESNGKNDRPETFVVNPPIDFVEPAENSISPLQHDGLKLLVPPNVGSLIIDNSQMNQTLDVTVQTNGPGLDEKGRTNLSFSPSASVLEDSNLGGQMNNLKLPGTPVVTGKEKKTYKDIVLEDSTCIASEVSQQHIVQNNVEIHLEEPLKVDKDGLTDKQIKFREGLKNTTRTTGKDAIITIENKQVDASVLESAPVTLGVTRTPALQHVESGSRAVATMAGEGRSLDIVKSIVYGGLIESIASLSVVSSAAGAGGATLNVLALGLANIFGGLFMIGHDLWDLKNERDKGSSDGGTKQEDRYQLLLGQRADFPLHMVISLLSYLVFGLLPPVVYGFSFRESNNRDLKLLMVATASIVCITLLAAGKAYVQRPHKSYFKTMAYYVVFGFMVSGVSYLFGELIMKFLEKIDIFPSGSDVNLSIQGASSTLRVATY